MVRPLYGEARDFSDGLAGVKLGDKWGFIDETGNKVIQAKYTSVLPFMNGLAKVTIGSGPTAKEYYVDKSGKVVWSDG